MPDEASDMITLRSLKSRKGGLVALSAVAKLQAALRIRAEVMGGLPDFSFILYGKVMYSKSFVLGKKKAKGQTAPSKKKSKGGAKGGKFVYDFHLLFPTMELGPFLKDSILKPLKEISDNLQPIIDPLRDLTKPVSILTRIQGKSSSILDFIAANAPEPYRVKAKSVVQLIKIVIALDDIIKMASAGDTGDCLVLAQSLQYNKLIKKFIPVSCSTLDPLTTGYRLEEDDTLSRQLCTGFVAKAKENCAKAPQARRARGFEGDHVVDGANVARVRKKTTPKKSKASLAKDKMNKYKKNFEIPLLQDPKKAMGLFSGKTVDLIIFNSPKAEFGADFELSINILAAPNIALVIGGGCSISASVIMGFDSYGIQQAIAQKNAALVFDSFYLLTEQQRDNGSWEKLWQVTVTGYIDLGVSLNLLVVKASAGGT